MFYYIVLRYFVKKQLIVTNCNNNLWRSQSYFYICAIALTLCNFMSAALVCGLHIIIKKHLK